MAKNSTQTLLVELDDHAAQEKLNELTKKRVIELELQFSSDFDKHAQEIEKRLGKLSRQLDSIRSGIADVGKESKNSSKGLLDTVSDWVNTASKITGLISTFKEFKRAQPQPSFG